MDPWSSSPLSVDVLGWQGWRRVHPFSGTSVICLCYCCCFSAGSDLGSLWEKGSLFPDHAAWWRYGGSAAPIPPPVLPSSWGPPYPLPAGVSSPSGLPSGMGSCGHQALLPSLGLPELREAPTCLRRQMRGVLAAPLPPPLHPSPFSTSLYTNTYKTERYSAI